MSHPIAARPNLPRLPLLALGFLLAQGCAFLSKNEPLEPRYFTLEAPRQAAANKQSGAGLKLRLGAVVAASDIRQYLMYRSADHELSYSNELRWTEKPEAYLRRGLSRALFEDRGIQRVVGGLAPTLEVELVAFEEIRQPPERVRIAAVLTLHDGSLVRVEKTMSRELPLGPIKGNERPEVVARTLGAAMAELIEEIAGEVIKR